MMLGQGGHEMKALRVQVCVCVWRESAPKLPTSRHAHSIASQGYARADEGSEGGEGERRP